MHHAAEQGTGDGREEARDAEDEHPGDHHAGAVGGQRHRRVGHAAEQPAEPAAHQPHHQQAGHHREREHQVVVGDVALGEGQAHRLAQRAGTEHDPERVAHLLDRDGEPERGQSQEHAGQPDGRDRDERADRHRREAGQQQRGAPRQPESRGQVPHRGGADGRERGLAQRHLSRGADQQAEREEQDDLGQRVGPERQLARVDDVRDDQQDGAGHGRACQLHPRGRGVDGRRAVPPHPPVGQPGPGREHEHQEQHDERDAGGQPGQRWAAGDDVLGRDRGGDPHHQTAGIGERQAGEPADRHGAERLHDQQGQHSGVQVERRRQQDAGQRREAGADDPGPPAHRRRAGAGQVEQLGIVHDAAHGQPEPGQPEEGEQRRGRGQRDTGDDHLVFADEYPAHADRVLRQPGGEGARQRAERRGEDALHGEDDADRGDHFHRRGRVRQPARDRLQDQPEHRSENGNADEGGGHGRQAELVVQDVEDVRPGRGHRALGEVEDARCLVGEHQPGHLTCSRCHKLHPIRTWTTATCL